MGEFVVIIGCFGVGKLILLYVLNGIIFSSVGEIINYYDNGEI